MTKAATTVLPLPGMGNPPLAGKATWVRGALELSPEASTKVIRKRLSASSADSLRGCVARWAAERLLPRSENPFGAAELGTATHQLYEDLFARSPGQRTPDDAQELLADLHVMHGAKVAAPDDPAELDSWRSEVWRRARGLWEMEDPSKVEVIGRELKLLTNVSGVPFIGFVDRVSIADGQVEVVDYKTGRVPNPRYGDAAGHQVRLYLMATATGVPELVGTDDPTELVGRLLYVTHTKEKTVRPSHGELATTRSMFTRSWGKQAKIAETRRYPTKVSALCGWCPLVEVCPDAIAAGKGPRDAVAFGGENLGVAPLVGPVMSVPDFDFPPDPDFDDVPELTVTAPVEGPVNESGDENVPDAPAPHTYLSEPDRPLREELVMTVKHEGKVWEEVTPDSDYLNTNSYAATAAFGMSSLAVDILHRAGQPVTGTTVTALARTFATLVAEVEADLRYRPSFQTGLHTRLRGALHTCLETIPPPFGDDLGAWKTWRATTKRRMLAISKVALELWETDLDELDPDESLATLATPRLAAVAGGRTGRRQAQAAPPEADYNDEES